MKRIFSILISIMFLILLSGPCFAGGVTYTDSNADGTIDYSTIPGIALISSGVAPGSSSTSILKTDVVELTNAQIKALRAIPKDLVAAPGAGKFIQFVGAVIYMDYGTNVLTESADNLVIQYGSGTDASAAIETTGFLDASADMVAVVAPAAVVGTATSSIANDELEVFNTGDGELAGNAAADTTITIYITYWIHTL